MNRQDAERAKDLKKAESASNDTLLRPAGDGGCVPTTCAPAATDRFDTQRVTTT
jgi:hypothetical protein